jgi:succinyl-CoA synthetase beta subunit
VLLTTLQAKSLLERYGFTVEPCSDPIAHFLFQLEIDRVTQQTQLNVTLWLEPNPHDSWSTSEIIHPLLGLQRYQLNGVASELGFPNASWESFTVFGQRVYQSFSQVHAQTMRLSVGVLSDTTLVIYDASIQVDEDVARSEIELTTVDNGIYYVPLDGQVACVGNGAGLVLNMMDTLRAMSDRVFRPFCFLEIDDHRLLDGIEFALEQLLNEDDCKVIVMNFFCTLYGCDEVAERVLHFAHVHPLNKLVCLRLEGIYFDEAFAILSNSKDKNLKITRAVRDVMLLVVNELEKGV